MKVLALLLASTVAAPAGEVHVLVAYYSQSGNTKKMAEAVAEGAGGVEGASFTLKPIADVSKADLEQADGLAIGSPVYMGDVAPAVREAFIRWSGDFGFWESRGLQDKAGAVFATGAMPSNGKEFTMWSMAQSLLQFGVVLVTPYGSMGASATTYRPEADQGVNDHELEVARALGERLAKVAGKLSAPPASPERE